MTGQLQYGSVVLWYCFDLQQMGPAAALEIPWYPCRQKKKKNNNKKNNNKTAQSSLPALHVQKVFIWITHPNPLSNDMSHYPPDTAWWRSSWILWAGSDSKHQWGTWEKWISEEENFWNDYGSSNLHTYGDCVIPKELPWHNYQALKVFFFSFLFFSLRWNIFLR